MVLLTSSGTMAPTKPPKATVAPSWIEVRTASSADMTLGTEHHFLSFSQLSFSSRAVVADLCTVLGKMAVDASPARRSQVYQQDLSGVKCRFWRQVCIEIILYTN